MLKSLSVLEQKIGDRVYHLMCSPDSPLGEIKEALIQFSAFVVALEKDRQQQMEAQQNEAAPDSPEAEVEVYCGNE